MGIPRLLFLKQIYTKPYFNLIRSLSSATVNSPIFNEIVNCVTSSPDASVVPLLDRYLVEDKTGLQDELPMIIRQLRKLKRYERAYEISEWTSHESLHLTDGSDLALQLDLIGKVHGVDAAEKFFNTASEQSEDMYRSLLNCYVQAKLVDTSLEIFNKMKELGIITRPLTYNSIMSLYLKTGQSKKISDLLQEMQDKGITPYNNSYKMCLKACAKISNFNSVDTLLNTMENLPHIKVEWCTVANYYIEGYHLEKAIICLQKAETNLQDNPAGFNNLISTYLKLGKVNEVMRIWENYKDACKLCNADYMVMLSALVKLEKFQEAEELLEECDSESMYGSLLKGYVQAKLVDKSLSHFNKMKELGIATSTLSYNRIMSLSKNWSI